MFFRRRKDDGLHVELPITPMLDMAFQLLIFFVLTYHPSELEGQVTAALPEKPAVPGPGGDETPGELDMPILVHVHTQHEAQGGGIVFPIVVAHEHETRKLDSMKELGRHLAQKHAQSPQAKVRIVGDDKLKWACMMQVVDVCQEAGFQQVGFGRPE